MKTVPVKLLFVILICVAFSNNIFAQKIENIKSTGIKAGIIFPFGEWSDNYGTGFMVADLSKWELSPNVRALGRLEIAFFGGKEITQSFYPGYSYTQTVSPLGILTAGMGFEFIPVPNSGFYGILDFPSMNILLTGSGFRVGVGVGFGYEFSWGKAALGVNARANVYNALLSQSSEQTLAGLQLGLEAAF